MCFYQSSYFDSKYTTFKLYSNLNIYLAHSLAVDIINA